VVKIKKVKLPRQRYWGHQPDLLRSRDVFGHVTIRLAVVHFLWVVHCDHASIWHSCGDMSLQMLAGCRVIAHFVSNSVAMATRVGQG